MSRNCRVLKSGKCEITQGYKNSHKANDIVGAGYTLDTIVAHSDGTVVQVINNCNINTSGDARYNSAYFDANNPGNMVKIKHDNGYYTRYLHFAYGTVKVQNGQRVSKGQELGYMGNTGYSFGGHLHFEVRNESDVCIDPSSYLDSDLPTKEPENIPTGEYNIGDIVEINGVYVSSTSSDKLLPAISSGKITRIVNGARNPYLLENGQIGWVNDECIISKKNNNIEYLSNPSYNGYSIVDALNQIGIDSSYNYRSQLAEKNGISGYIGSAEQNTRLLDLLKQGKLIKA